MITIKYPERLYNITPNYQEDSYGDAYVAAKYCGFTSIPARYKGEWQHGWIGEERNIHPEWVIGSDGLSTLRKNRDTFFVARQDQVDYLCSQGYKNVEAIGMPILYVEPPKLDRLKGSLLVMPTHSLPEFQGKFDEDLYINYIKSISHHFSHICLCVHKSCERSGHWLKTFQEQGIQVVVGADPADSNSLLRMAYLFSQFDYVTTNNMGSQIAYASYFGCKVSIAGPEYLYEASMLEEVPFYKNAPEVLQIGLKFLDEGRYRQLYPQFYREPWLAIENKKWAAYQLGEIHKKTPKELKILFGWTLMNRLYVRAKRYINNIFNFIYNDIIIKIGYIKTLGFNRGCMAIIKTAIGKRLNTGLTSIYYAKNISLSLRNGSTDISVFEQHFLRREILDIPFSLRNVNTIIDLGANIGVSSAIFRILFPSARIVAVELDKKNTEMMQNNHRHDPLIEVINGAIWSHSGKVSLKDIGDGDWAFQVDPTNADVTKSVLAFSFEDLINNHDIPIVDIMKMDIEGAEADVLEASGDVIFAKTKISIIEVHDWMPGIKERVEKVINDCGHRLDLAVSMNGEFWIIENRALNTDEA